MDPLSMLPSLMRTEIRPFFLPGGVADGKNLSIPTSELASLGGATGPVPTIGPSAAPSSQPLNISSGGGSFENTLGQVISGVGQKQAAADSAVNGLLAGQSVPLHEAMISMEEASISFQLMVEVRNKLLESYQELMRMQI